MTKSHKDWLDLNVDNVEPMELSTEQKVHLKQTILKKATKKRTPKWVRHLTAAAIIGVSTITTINFAFPTLASQIPFMKNIIGYFDNTGTMFEKFGNYATEIGQVQTSNGISMMIENAVYDGTSVTISYALETDVDLGSHPFMLGDFIDFTDSVGGGGGVRLEKVSDTKYAGLANLTPYFDKEAPEEIEVVWKPRAIMNTTTNTEVQGDWKFKFTVPKLERNLQLLNETVATHGVTARFIALGKNDMTTVIHYEYDVKPDLLKEWPFIDIYFDELKDNLGNTYTVNGNGSLSKDNGISYQTGATVQSIDPAATSITFVPVIYFSLGSGKGGEEKEMDPVTINLE